MRKLASLGVYLVMGRFETHVARSVSYATEALALAREQTLDLDEIDQEVLTDRIITASFLLGNLLRLMHDELDGLDDAAAMAAVTEIAGRRRRPLPVRHVGRSEYLLLVLGRATSSVNRSIRLLKRWCRDGGKIDANLRSVRANLCLAVHVLDPTTLDFLRPEIDSSLEACRDDVRERRWGAGGSRMPV